MPENEDGRPVAGGAGAPAQQAGETCGQSTHAADIPAPDVPWIRRRGGDPVVIRRRLAAALDDLLGIWSDAVDLDDWYGKGWASGGPPFDGDYWRDGGMHLGVLEREAAAPAPLVCAA